MEREKEIGHLKIQVRKEMLDLTHTIAREVQGDDFVLRICDSGIGIEPETILQFCDPFARPNARSMIPKADAASA